MYLAHELKAIFRHSRNLAEELEKITSQYRNCGTISDVTKCDKCKKIVSDNDLKNSAFE
jgi:hypothetical protein